MTLHSFYTPALTADSQILELPQAEAHHAAAVLRLEAGERIRLLNGNGITATAQLTDIQKKHASCQILEIEQHPKPRQIHLYVAPPRNKNMEIVIRCATELGVSQITPVITQYTVAKPQADKEGWLQTAITACKQSRNPYFPVFDAPICFSEALTNAKECHFLGAVPKDGAYATPSIPPAPAPLALWIGPEGGFSNEEVEMLMNAQAIPLTIGPCILRVETAVPALLGAIYALTR